MDKKKAFSFVIPHNMEISKNKRYGKGFYIRGPHKQAQAACRDLCAGAMLEAGITPLVDPEPICVAISVFRPNMRADPVNVIDGICDTIKDPIGVDDRWFFCSCGWKIDRKNPRIEITVSWGYGNEGAL